jgi:hypothetical protein
MQASQISCAGAYRQYGTKQDCRIAPYFIGRNRRIVERKPSSLRIFAKFCTPKYATYHFCTGAATFTTLVFFLYNYRHRRFTFYNFLYTNPLFLPIIFNISLPIQYVIPQYVLRHIIKISAYLIILTKLFANFRRRSSTIRAMPQSNLLQKARRSK